MHIRKTPAAIEYIVTFDATFLIERSYALSANVGIFRCRAYNRIISDVVSIPYKLYPGQVISPKMTKDLRRVFQILIAHGADKNNTSTYSKKNDPRTLRKRVRMADLRRILERIDRS